jgi:hypothetical protein
MAETIADYPDAVDRIVAANVDPNATTEQQVQQALRAANAPQVTREVADMVADEVLTEERVLAAIEGSGEVPSDGEIEAIAAVSDDYDMTDRQAQVAAAIREQVVTVEDVERATQRAVESAEREDRPTFKEDIETALDSETGDKQLLGGEESTVVDEQASQVGAPSETSFRGAVAGAIGGGEQVSGQDAGVSDRSTASVVVQDEQGNAVAVTGGREDDGQAIADERGVPYLSQQQFEGELSVSGSGETVDVTLRGRKVAEART